jgi:CheY-like chemotaxis protein
MPRLFLPYQQGSIAPLVTGEKGAGIGLALVKRTADQLGGAISVHSQPGQGATFRLSIPLRTVESTDNLEAITQVDLKARFLVVEDLPYNLKLLTDLLASWGAVVDGARDGREAIEHCHRCRYDLILMDFDLPDITGNVLTPLIHAIPEHQSTPIIGLSAYTDQDYIQRALGGGMVDYLFKPLNTRQLIECLERHIPALIRCERTTMGNGLSARPALRRLHLVGSENSGGLTSEISYFSRTLHELVEKLNQCDLASEAFIRIVHQLKGLSSYIHHTPSIDYWNRLMQLSNDGERQHLLDSWESMPSVVTQIERELRAWINLESDFKQLLPDGDEPPKAFSP